MVRVTTEALLLLLLQVSALRAAGIAYISILSSDDFVLAARVVNKALQSFNKSIPFVVLVTEDVGNHTLAVLAESGIRIEYTRKLDTPYASTHHGAKYHVYEMMLNATTQLYSYDGGDQGFMNSFFSRLKYAPMFDSDNPTRSTSDGGFRLSSMYNFDVGMHYLNGRYLLRPKIIHYTLGPVKPWMWWTYPVFDLHWKWLRVRRQLERDSGIPIVRFGLFLNQIYLAIFLVVGYQALSLYMKDRLRCRRLNWEAAVFSVPSLAISLISAYLLIPTQTHPIFAWIVFYIDTVLIWIWIGMLYSSNRLGRPTCSGSVLKNTTRFAVTAGAFFTLQWLLLFITPIFLLRGALVIATIPLVAAILCQQYTQLILNSQQGYKPLSYH